MQIDDNFLEFKNNIFIHKSAKIGENVKIDPFVFIGKNVEILDYSKISSHTVIGSEPEMPGESGSNFTVLIGKYVTVREFVSIDAGFKRNTIIEDDVYVMNHSHIAHDCYIKKNAIISAGVTLAGDVQIGEECFLGLESVVHQGSVIGDVTILGANSFAKGELLPCLKYVGNPAKPISINEVGLLRSKKNKVELQKLVEIAKSHLDAS